MKYDTCDDYWQDDDGTFQIRVAKCDNHLYDILVAVHEIIEQQLCYIRGINEEDITDFDKLFEEVRNDYPIAIGDMEPGNMISAPYYNEHVFATKIEKQLADELGVDWDKYDDILNKM